MRRAASESPEERSRILRLIQAAWDSLRRLVSAVLHALGFKRSAAAAAQITSENDITKAASSVEQDLLEASEQNPSFQQALDFCGFDALQQGLLRVVEKAETLDDKFLARLSSPVFTAVSQRLLDLDARLNLLRQDLALAAEPLASAFGGPPLLLEDVVRISRGVDQHACSPEQAAAIQQVLHLDKLIRVGIEHKSVVVEVAKNFAHASVIAGVDLSGLEDEISQALGDNWRGSVSTVPVLDQPQAAADRPRAADWEAPEVGGSPQEQAHRLASEAVQAASQSAARVQTKPSGFDRLRAMSASAPMDSPDHPFDAPPQRNTP